MTRTRIISVHSFGAESASAELESVIPPGGRVVFFQAIKDARSAMYSLFAVIEVTE